MRIKVYETSEKLFGAAAETVASLIKLEAERKEGCIDVCLSADSSNIGMMKELVYEDVSWKNTRLFSSWEFINENSVSDISRRKKIDEALISKLTTFDAQKNGQFFEGSIAYSSSSKYSADVPAGFDVFSVEIMPYGSLLMNLPLTECFDSRTVYRDSEDLLGSAVLTVSPYGVMKSKHIISIASGYKMAQWVAYLVSSEFSQKCPAAILKEHPDFILLLDKEAASCIPQCYL